MKYKFENKYYDTLEEVIEIALPIFRTDNNGISKPMKAMPYYKTKTVDGKLVKTNEPRMTFPVYAQPKLNGFRVMARWEEITTDKGTLLEATTEGVVFRSKEGLRYDILEHIEAEFTKEMFSITDQDANITQLVFDGEMYIHGEILSEISSAVRKRNPKTILLQFHIFDLAVEKLTQKARLDTLSLVNEIYFIGKTSIVHVNHIRIESNERAQIFTDTCIKQGYEGAIFRDMKATYQFGKRPSTMTKLKRSEDKEFRIVDVVGGENTPDLAVFVCVQEEGLQFDCTPEGSVEVKREYLANKHKYIGKMLTIRFFERTKDNKPFHATGVAIRDYE